MWARCIFCGSHALDLDQLFKKSLYGFIHLEAILDGRPYLFAIVDDILVAAHLDHYE